MEIELYSKLQNPIEAIERIGRMFAKSNMFGCEREEQGQVLAMICLAEHKSPVAITRDYDIVEGKLRKKALAALADFRAIGGKHKWLSSGDAPAAKEEDHYAEIQLTDKAGETIKYRYSMADARAEGLLRDKSRWLKRPGNMLRARCISNGLGMLCPELYAGGDEDSDTVPTQSPGLNLQSSTSAAPTEPKPATMVEVKTVAADEKQEAKMGLAQAVEVKATVVAEPAPTSTPTEPQKFAAGPKYDAPATPLLSDALAAEVEKAIADTPEDLARAYKWMAKEGWLKDGQDLRFLTDARARRIIKQRDSFRKAVKEANL